MEHAFINTSTLYSNPKLTLSVMIESIELSAEEGFFYQSELETDFIIQKSIIIVSVSITSTVVLSVHVIFVE